jgi:hypothetical protein
MSPIQLFRVLLPSWKFFDRAAPVPGLWVRYSRDGATWNEWIDRLPPGGDRDWERLFWNPRENERFAAFAVLSQFAEDPKDPVSLELVTRLAVRGLSGDPDPGPGAAAMQFKLVSDGRDLFVFQPMRVPR